MERRVYKIVKTRCSSDLSGEGAKLYGGRWNPAGIPVLYTAETRALATLEALVHIPLNVLSNHFSLVEIQIPAVAKIYSLSLSSLPVNWMQVNRFGATQEIGRKWQQEGKYAVLKVPSAVIPEEYNLLINPGHPDVGKLKVIKKRIFKFDEQLI